MKQQYFGDVNDYLKYGLLRCLVDAGFRIGVCWMLTPDDGRSDGGKLRYLSQPALWRGHDPPLFDALRSIVGDGAARSTTIAEESSLFPGTSFFSNHVPDAGSLRGVWFSAALSALSASDLLFFDPDNGFEVASKPMGRRDSSKYLYWSEVASAWAGGASLLVFQHFPREARAAYVARVVRRLGEEAPGATVTALVTSNVLFLRVWQPVHVSRVEMALALLGSRWAGRVSIWDAPSDEGASLASSRKEGVSSLPAIPIVGTAVPSADERMTSLRNLDVAITNAMELTAAELAHRRVVCPACGIFIFRMWPEGWDAHAAYRCSGLAGSVPEERKREFRERFDSLFRSR
jgi:hypothetical protein